MCVNGNCSRHLFIIPADLTVFLTHFKVKLDCKRVKLCLIFIWFNERVVTKDGKVLSIAIKTD